MKITVLLPNGMFGYLTNICNCDECKKRGQAEFELFDEKGRYIQHVKYSELKDREIIEHYNPYDLCDLLHEKLISNPPLKLEERIKFLEKQLDIAIKDLCFNATGADSCNSLDDLYEGIKNRIEGQVRKEIKDVD